MCDLLSFHVNSNAFVDHNAQVAKSEHVIIFNIFNSVNQADWSRVEGKRNRWSGKAILILPQKNFKKFFQSHNLS